MTAYIEALARKKSALYKDMVAVDAEINRILDAVNKARQGWQ